ncbi:hypothetical protein wVul_1659 [Wolbachia endosymbiont of Armadillidium vulgare str. wVulC]|nr:hypothetical protein wVul_1659 [Wolbachia endosymbiont of Armadillidium vulgare str. wVulC]
MLTAQLLRRKANKENSCSNRMSILVKFMEVSSSMEEKKI